MKKILGTLVLTLLICISIFEAKAYATTDKYEQCNFCLSEQDFTSMAQILAYNYDAGEYDVYMINKHNYETYSINLRVLINNQDPVGGLEGDSGVFGLDDVTVLLSSSSRTPLEITEYIKYISEAISETASADFNIVIDGPSNGQNNRFSDLVESDCPTSNCGTPQGVSGFLLGHPEVAPFLLESSAHRKVAKSLLQIMFGKEVTLSVTLVWRDGSLRSYILIAAQAGSQSFQPIAGTGFDKDGKPIGDGDFDTTLDLFDVNSGDVPINATDFSINIPYEGRLPGITRGCTWWVFITKIGNTIHSIRFECI